MKIQWSIDNKKLRGGGINGYRETKKQMRYALEYIRQVWLAQVSGAAALEGTRPLRSRKYADSLIRAEAIKIPDGHPLSGAVVSTFPYARDIELGYPPFDMKKGILSGPKSRQGKNGRYAIIPFRWGTPGYGASEEINDKMDGPLYDVAKRLRGVYESRLNADGGPPGEVSESQLVDVDKQHATGWAVPRVSHSGYEHIRPVAAGIRKEGAPRHRQYRSYRTVSENSDPKSWIHPGAQPNPIMAAVIRETEETVNAMLVKGIQDDIDAVFS